MPYPGGKGERERECVWRQMVHQLTIICAATRLNPPCCTLYPLVILGYVSGESLVWDLNMHSLILPCQAKATLSAALFLAINNSRISLHIDIRHVKECANPTSCIFVTAPIVPDPSYQPLVSTNCNALSTKSKLNTEHNKNLIHGAP